MESTVVVSGKELRRGYTTGSCAAGAAAAAAELLLTGMPPAAVRLDTPAGITLCLPVEDAHIESGAAVCAVRKDAGDDPDVTHGMRIYARAAFGGEGVSLCGGEGVGRVTKPGLSVPVGEPAINPVPRKQIKEAVCAVCKKQGDTRGIIITISAENGAEIAKKTFNSRLGIEGGLSILGTSGIVEPMSEKALVETIRVEIDSRFANGDKSLLMCPGNYGKDFARDTLGVDLDRAVTISNFIGEALDYAVYKGFERALLIGHAGKLVKLAAGVMQTHSSYADGRQEIFAAHAALHGAGQDIVRRLMESVTVDACLAILREADLESLVLQSISNKIDEHLSKRTRGALRVEFILFTNQNGELSRTKGAGELLKNLQE